MKNAVAKELLQRAVDYANHRMERMETEVSSLHETFTLVQERLPIPVPMDPVMRAFDDFRSAFLRLQATWEPSTF